MNLLAKIFIPVAAFLAACAAIDPIVVTPTDTITVDKPIPVACLKDLPPYPELPVVPAANIEAQTRAKNERELVLREFADKLYAALSTCKELK